MDDDPLALDQVRLYTVDAPNDLRFSFFGSPSQAFEAFQRDPFELVIADLKMGTTTGIELIRRMQVIAPESIYIILSGEADFNDALTAVNDINVFRFLTKPSSALEFSRSIADAVVKLNAQAMRDIGENAIDLLADRNRALLNIDAKGRLLFANEPGREILRQSEVFQGSMPESLMTRDKALNDAMRATLDALSQSDQESEVFRLDDPGQEHPLSLLIRKDKQKPDHFIVLFFNPNQKDLAPADTLRKTLGLSHSEARIVSALIEEGSLEAGAEAAGLKISTARTYLKNVFNKTGTNRQAELVKLALASSL
ncbi:MAG: response regulator [Pseudomonadota bacterium]